MFGLTALVARPVVGVAALAVEVAAAVPAVVVALVVVAVADAAAVVDAVAEVDVELPAAAATALAWAQAAATRAAGEAGGGVVAVPLEERADAADVSTWASADTETELAAREVVVLAAASEVATVELDPSTVPVVASTEA